MTKTGQQEAVRELLDTYGRTYADEAGIHLKDTPQPLYRLLVMSVLLSARIRSSTALAAARALHDGGMGDARRMAEASWQDRVDALGRGGYRRYDERTATQLGEGAELVLDKYGGDLRRLRKAAREEADDKGGGKTTASLRRLLQEVPGLGPTGADIFLREVQGVWPEVAPYLDKKALQGAQQLGLPGKPDALAPLIGDASPAVFAAALVRASLDKGHALEEEDDEDGDGSGHKGK
ncbi:endonuclease [Streptomyces sp. NPDC003077]|uniref:endonuclease n=1 Tax=Streptomyces sp. NPDC003077 TaxID=3154443 RepID=UPI0033B21579